MRDPSMQSKITLMRPSIATRRSRGRMVAFALVNDSHPGTQITTGGAAA